MSSRPCSTCHLSPSQFTCSCVSPAPSLCTACLPGHISTPSQHFPQSIPHRGNERAEMCEECGAGAVLFCLCGSPLRKICAGCDIAHYQKAPNATHSKHPIDLYSDLMSGKAPLDAFIKKQLYINSLQSTLSQELYRFDAFTQDVRQELDLLIGKIVAKREEILQGLQLRQRPKLVAAVAAVQQTIERKRYLEPLEIGNCLDDFLGNGYKSARKFDLKLFSGLVNMQEIEGNVGKSVICDVFPSPEFAQRDIPVIKDNSLRLFSPKTLKMKEVSLSQHTKIDEYSFYCYISDDTLLCCGGTSHKEVHEVNIRSGIVTKVANMNFPRGFAGIWNYQGKSVYVFGGQNIRYSENAEKYDLEGKFWTNLRDCMKNAKCCCSVCEHSSGIYLSGCESARVSVEFFNPLTETFKLLLTDTPRFVPILCCLGEELFIIKQNTIEVASLANGPNSVDFTVKATFTALGIPFYGSFCPMQFFKGELVGGISSCGAPCGLFCFKPGKLQFSQVLAFTY